MLILQFLAVDLFGLAVCIGLKWWFSDTEARGYVPVGNEKTWRLSTLFILWSARLLLVGSCAITLGLIARSIW